MPLKNTLAYQIKTGIVLYYKLSVLLALWGRVRVKHSNFVTHCVSSLPCSTTFRIMTLSIMTLNIMDSIVTFNINDSQHKALGISII